MNRLKKTLIISTFVLSALIADLSFCSTAFAHDKEAVEFNRKGVAALESGRYNDSIQALKKAMAIEPTWGEPCYNAARLLRLMGKREDMIKMLRKANGVEPDNQKYLDEYLKVLYEDYKKAESSSNTSEMEQIKSEIFRVNPGNLILGLKTVEKKIDSDQDKEALLLAEDVIAKNAKNRSNYDLKELGQIYYLAADLAYGQGDLDKAKTYADYASRYNFEKKEDASRLLKKIRNNIDDKVKELISQAKVAQKAGNHSKAMSLLSQAEALQPDNETIKSSKIEFVDEVDINKLIEEARKANANGKWLDAREILVMLLEKYDSEEAKKMLKELKAKEAKYLTSLDIQEIPLTAAERKSVFNNYKNRGIEFFEANNYKKSEASLKKAIVMTEADSALRSERPKVEEYLEKMKKMDEDKDNWAKARDARESGDYEDVIKYLKLIPDDYDIQLYSFLAEAYYNTGETEKAEECARLQLAKQPENNRAKFILGSIKLDAGDNEQAYRYLYEIYQTDSNYPGLGDKLAKASVKFWPQVVFYTVMILVVWILWIIYKRYPIYKKDAIIKDAKRSFKRENYDDAIKLLMDVRHSPYLTPADNFEITKLFAQCYLKKGTYDKAIGECKHLISLSPKSEEAHTWLGYAYLGRRMLAPEALPELLNLYKKDSRNIALVSLLGSYYAQQKVISEDGIAILEQWLNLDHDNVEVLRPLGQYYLKKNRSDEKAMKVFQKMMEIGSPDPDFLLGVANVYLKTRQFDQCLQLCEHVINEDINNNYVHSILLEAYKKQNRLSELLDIYANFLQNNPYNVAFQNGLRAAQDAYNKIQNKNAAQAANEAAAVMEKMRMATQSENYGSEDNEFTNQEVAPGEVPCPNCGKGNPQGGYVCQFCGANMIQ